MSAKAVFMIGSGASVPYRMPRFADLFTEVNLALGYESRRITTLHKQWLRRSLDLLPKTIGRYRDAEDALVKLEEQVYSRGASREMLDTLRMGIWWLMITRTDALAGTPGPYDALVRRLGRFKDRCLLFDLNWDELLEGSLRQHDSREGWFPGVSGAIRRSETEHLRLLKPHGSVSLIATSANDEWDETLRRAASTDDTETYDWNAARDGMRPLMVYPGIATSSSHWYLWGARRRLHKALRVCKVVVMIGVGLCETDRDIVRLVEHAMWHRLSRHDGQLRGAFAVDMASGRGRTDAIQRIQEALRPSRMYAVTEGLESWVESDWAERAEQLLSEP